MLRKISYEFGKFSMKIYKKTCNVMHRPIKCGFTYVCL